MNVFRKLVSTAQFVRSTGFIFLSLASSYLLLTTVPQVVALGSQQNPQSGSAGLEGRIASPPPAIGATISLPVNGSTFTATPITVSGICPSGLLVKFFSNNIFVGSVQCTNGSFSIQIDLFSGENDLIARVYDALDQAGPDSNTVKVTFVDGQFAQFGSHVSITSNFAKLGADPGSVLSWPLILSGGAGPYALSVDWGDGTSPGVISQPFAGTLNVTHVYKTAGVYKVIVRASDANGTTAFLQLVGVANGKVTQGNNGSNTGLTTVKTKVIWWPFAVLLPLIIAAFWLGTRYELLALHRQIERQSSEYDNQ